MILLMENYSLLWILDPPYRLADQEFSFQAAEVDVFVVVKVLADLGCFLGLQKCVLIPMTSILYIGELVESVVYAFSVSKEESEGFAQLGEGILAHKFPSL